MPPKNPGRDPGRNREVDSSNPRRQGEGDRGEVWETKQPFFLKKPREYLARKKHEADTNKFLKNADFYGDIRGIKIYVDKSSMRENGPLLEELIKSLQPIISILPNEMVKRTRLIKLETFLKGPTYPFLPLLVFAPLLFTGESHVDVGVKIEIYPNRFENFMLPEIEIKLAEIFFYEVVHLIVFGDPNESSRMLRNYKLSQCQNSLEKYIPFLTDLIDEKSLEEWLEISRQSSQSSQSGGYVSTRLTSLKKAKKKDLRASINFGYIFSPNVGSGRLNLVEDIACVFEKIFSSLYKVIHRKEDPKDVISDLLSKYKTRGEIGLHKKYLIACESLIRWYEENTDQREILTEFIQKIKDVIKKAKEATDG